MFLILRFAKTTSLSRMCHFFLPFHTPVLKFSSAILIEVLGLFLISTSTTCTEELEISLLGIVIFSFFYILALIKWFSAPAHLFAFTVRQSVPFPSSALFLLLLWILFFLNKFSTRLHRSYSYKATFLFTFWGTICFATVIFLLFLPVFFYLLPLKLHR